MASGSRPGGLTALAVINFVFGGLAGLGVLGMIALLGLANKATGGELAKTPGAGIVVFAIAIMVVVAALLITSGIGYLGQKKILGRVLGSVYGGLGVLNVVINLTLLKGEFGIMTIVSLIYPVLTLFLLNTTFKDDFINP